MVDSDTDTVGSAGIDVELSHSHINSYTFLKILSEAPFTARDKRNMAPSQRLEDDHMRQDHANYELSEPRGLDLLQEAVHHVREYECSSKDVEAAHAIISECLDHTLGTVVARFAFDLPEKLQDEHGRNGILDPCRITCDAIHPKGVRCKGRCVLSPTEASNAMLWSHTYTYTELCKGSRACTHQPRDIHQSMCHDVGLPRIWRDSK